jgi:hypothetical protein
MNEFERLVNLIEYWYGFNPNTANFANFLFDNGVILPPVKVGDTVYRLVKNACTHQWSIKEAKVRSILVDQTELRISCEKYPAPCTFGKLIFSTKEEAENALREKRFGR